jgi:hypothetical protein
MVAIGHALLAALFVGTGCSSTLEFRCEDSAACDVPDDRRVCQPTGYCSARDPSCPDGWRYVEHAPEALANTCVEHGDLLGHWAFEDGLGGVAADSSPHGNNGNLIHGPVWSVGVSGGGLKFDGADDQVEMPGIVRFGAMSWSAFAWVNSVDASAVQTRILGAGFDPGYAFLNFGNGRPEVEAYDSLQAFWGVYANAGTSVADTDWHLIGFVIDRERGETRLYIDAAFESRAPQTSAGVFGTDQLVSTVGAFRVGGQNGGAATALEAVIDEVRVYIGVVSELDIRAIYESDAR